MMSDSSDNSKFQVAELRAELEAKGLDTEGSQLVVERLREEALLQHAHDEVETEIKEELGNGYECSVKSEEIYIKEELIESEQEPSDTGDEAEDESEYDKSAVVLDWRIKREPGTDLQGPLPRAFSANEFAEPKQEPFEERRGEKRQASNQRGPPDSKRCRPESADKHTDDAPYHDKEAVILDWHNRDLSLIIDKETFLSAKPMTSEDFAYAWHGVRARYGFLRGRLFYEVKVKDHLAVPHLEGEEHPHIVRCGWSIDDAGMTLGEEPFSYGYDGTAKASTDLKIKDYGQPFGKGDVIGCFLDMDSEPITMSFSVNGKNFGKCYEVSRHSLRGKALFPHILTKNCTFKVNFGSEYPCFQPMARYRFVGQIPLVERVLGSQGPQTRQDSECVLRNFIVTPKWQNGASDGTALKKRKAITMDVKLDIIKRSEKGETNTEIGRSLGLSRTTVLSIVKDKQRILEHVKIVGPNETVITKQRTANLVEMETLLVTWLEDQNQRHVPVSLSMIQEKARELHKVVVKKNGEGSASEEFAASRGWFNRFKARANFRSLKLQGEAAGADQEVADRFPRGLAEIIREGGYSAEQVFNVDETGLFWKRMPSRTYISKEQKSASGHKASKERLTLLLGSNASGDFKLKPLLVYLVEDPRALKGIFKTQLPVIWNSNKKAWVTLVIFEDWFVYHFVPAVEQYCASKKLPFKVLLVLDSAPCHPTNLNDLNPNVKVVYLPPNTTSVLQPMDKGVITNFKAYYLRRTIHNAFRAIQGNKLTLKEFLKSYSILDAIKNIASAWEEIKQTNLNGAWMKLCPQFLNDSVGLEKVEDLETVTKRIVWYSKKLGLAVEAKDIRELLASHGEELTSEDLIELEKQMIKEEEETPAPKLRQLSVEGLSKGFSHIEKGLALIEAQDPNMERFMKVRRGVMACLTFYRKTLQEKQMKKTVQCRLEAYFKKKSPTPSTIHNQEVMSSPDSLEPEPEPVASSAPSDSQTPADSTS
ncbi:tigger transposable element-derived protein 1-like isoform X2 [Macrobrachium nipponense]|uniref:tigger transposable element-derived protein 1-like isoform X2 n=1 Tax=Macrobrachium nipponense TaxID=159736 RepID=UPI0030C86832